MITDKCQLQLQVFKFGLQNIVDAVQQRGGISFLSLPRCTLHLLSHKFLPQVHVWTPPICSIAPSTPSGGPHPPEFNFGFFGRGICYLIIRGSNKLIPCIFLGRNFTHQKKKPNMQDHGIAGYCKEHYSRRKISQISQVANPPPLALLTQVMTPVHTCSCMGSMGSNSRSLGRIQRQPTVN